MLKSRIAGGDSRPLHGAVFERLDLWMDDLARDGFDNMAVDEWLLDAATRPVLRVYAWRDGWGSHGYFVPAAEAARSLPELRWVRRRTGGGIVDHRTDWTYTLVVPQGEPLAAAKGGESYRIIHAALAEALGGAGVRLAPDRGPARGGECFARPVEFDLIDAAGRKIAGAGQRRSKGGLLHQGSLAIGGDPGLARRLAASLARAVVDFTSGPGPMEVARRACRYRDPAWAGRR
jgi:lipoate-protein ligase A